VLVGIKLPGTDLAFVTGIRCVVLTEQIKCPRYNRAAVRYQGRPHA